jgi:DNA repair protein RecO (recombination protein O)
MLHKTKGICISFLKYKETSIIAKIYTQEFGLQSYLINGVRTEKPKFKIALFQALTLLDMVVYHKQGRANLQRVSEIRCSQPYQHIPFDFAKSGLAIFLSEVLLKTLQEEEKNEDLFEFLEQAFLVLDSAEKVDNFALEFLLKLLEKQGLLGQDLEEIFSQLYQNKLCPRPDALKIEMEILKKIYKGEAPHIPNILRQQLINYLLAYFRLHYEFFGEIKSLQVLRSLMA